MIKERLFRKGDIQMGMERDRIAKRKEKNLVAECNKIQRKFYPELFTKFGQIADPRHNSYIDYSSRIMLGTVYYKGIAGIPSIRVLVTLLRKTISHYQQKLMTGIPILF